MKRMRISVTSLKGVRVTRVACGILWINFMCIKGRWYLCRRTCRKLKQLMDTKYDITEGVDTAVTKQFFLNNSCPGLLAVSDEFDPVDVIDVKKILRSLRSIPWGRIE